MNEKKNVWEATMLLKTYWGAFFHQGYQLCSYFWSRRHVRRAGVLHSHLSVKPSNYKRHFLHLSSLEPIRKPGSGNDTFVSHLAVLHDEKQALLGCCILCHHSLRTRTASRGRKRRSCLTWRWGALLPSGASSCSENHTHPFNLQLQLEFSGGRHHPHSKMTLRKDFNLLQKTITKCSHMMSELGITGIKVFKALVLTGWVKDKEQRRS